MCAPRRTTPIATRRARSIKHAAGYDVRLTDAPLDFLAVTDHSEYLGILPAMNDPQHPLSKIPYAPDLFSHDRERSPRRSGVSPTALAAGSTCRSCKRSGHHEARVEHDHRIRRAALRPGQFTTFIGYEFTSRAGRPNLHRNVIFAGSKRRRTCRSPRWMSQNPEELVALDRCAARRRHRGARDPAQLERQRRPHVRAHAVRWRADGSRLRGAAHAQ